MWHELNAEIELELQQLRRLVNDASVHLASLRERQLDMWDLNAVGGVLHSFYCGVENVLTAIIRRTDGQLPKGRAWHVELLRRVQEASTVRPPVITAELAEDLRDYLGFRHVFRQHYPFDLDWDRMEPLTERMQLTLERFESELAAFRRELDGDSDS